MPIAKALAITDGDVGAALDEDCLNALKRSLVRVDFVQAA
jgi:hypothetical protein